MGFWDSGTHMTKTEWRAACTRTLNRIDLVTPVPGTPPAPRPAAASREGDAASIAMKKRDAPGGTEA